MSERGGVEVAQEPDSRGISAIVLGHGDFAGGLVSATAQITGRGSRLLSLSNQGLSGERLEEALHAAIAASGARLVFTDLPGGSWTIAARRVQREIPSLVVITGVNLPMLLDVVYRDEGEVEELARRSAERGRSAVTVSQLSRAAGEGEGGVSGGASRGGAHVG